MKVRRGLPQGHQRRVDQVRRGRQVEDREAARSTEEEGTARPPGGAAEEEIPQLSLPFPQLPGSDPQPAGHVQRHDREGQVRSEDDPGRLPVLGQIELVGPPGREAPTGREVAADQDGLRDLGLPQDRGEIGQRTQGEETQRSLEIDTVDPVRDVAGLDAAQVGPRVPAKRA